MMHKNRRFNVADVESAEKLADDLERCTWTLCTGFRLAGYLFLNDSTSEDGAEEYAVVRERDMVQLESITFGWCDREEKLEYIRGIVAGRYDKENYGTIDRTKIEGRGHECARCA